MEPNLATTNVLLGIMAAVSVLESLAVIGFFLGAFLLYRRILHLVGGIEERQVAPAAARVNAILDDIKDVTSTVKEEAGRVEWVLSSLPRATRSMPLTVRDAMRRLWTRRLGRSVDSTSEKPQEIRHGHDAHEALALDNGRAANRPAAHDVHEGSNGVIRPDSHDLARHQVRNRAPGANIRAHTASRVAVRQDAHHVHDFRDSHGPPRIYRAALRVSGFLFGSSAKRSI